MMRQSAEIRGQLRGGNLIGDIDLLFSATAIAQLSSRWLRATGATLERMFGLDLYQVS
jgi:hypothetical protein